jgi:signal peptidase II
MIKGQFKQKTLTVIIFGLALLDQLTKWIVKWTMLPGESIPVMGDFFRLTFIYNPGMAFGMRLGNTYLFLALSIFAAGLVFHYLYRFRNEDWVLQLSLSMIAAGAVGNLLDRFLYGKVVDFLDFEFPDIIIPPFNFIGLSFNGYSLYRWPVFNVADMAVTGGIILLMIYIIVVGDPLEKAKKSTSATSGHE